MFTKDFSYYIIIGVLSFVNYIVATYINEKKLNSNNISISFKNKFLIKIICLELFLLPILSGLIAYVFFILGILKMLEIGVVIIAIAMVFVNFFALFGSIVKIRREKK